MITLQKEFLIDLKDIITTQINSWQIAKEGIRAKEEAAFQRRIQDGMSYEDQLAYRQDQLKKEEESSVPDRKFIDEVETNISLVKKLARNAKLRNKYTESLNAYTTGKSSVELYIKSLKSELETENDPTMKEFLQGKIQEAEVLAYTAEGTVLKNKIDVATKDKSITLIDEAIRTVESKKSQALLNGREDLVSTYDVMLSTLKGTKGTIGIEDKVNNLKWSVNKTGAEAMQKMNTLNTLINQADGTNSVFMDGKKYNSEQEYWLMARDTYLAGNGTGIFADFTTELGNEIKTNLAKTSIQNTFGYIPTDYIDSVDRIYKDLMARPEMQPFINKLETQRLDSISTAVTTSAKAITGEASFTMNYDKGMTALQALSKKYGIDLSAEQADLLNKKMTEIAAKVAATQKLAEMKGTTYKEEATKLEEQAKIEGVSPIEQVIPPATVIGQTPEQREAAYKAAGIPMPEKTTPVPKTTIPKTVTPPVVSPVTKTETVTPPKEPTNIQKARIDPRTGQVIGSLTFPVSTKVETKPKIEVKTETKPVEETWWEKKAREAKESGLKYI